MKYAVQIRLTMWVGGTFLLIGLIKMMIPWDAYAGTLAALGVIILFFGVVVRGIHRWQWRVSQGSGDMLSKLAANRYMRGPLAPFLTKWLALHDIEQDKTHD